MKNTRLIIEEDEYIESRLDDQIKWYSSKATRNKIYFKISRSIEIVSASLIVLLCGLVNNSTYYLHIIGLLGCFIAISITISSVYKYNKNWIQYRSTSETLKNEKYLYLTKSKPYSIDSPFNLLVCNVESIISRENSSYR